MKKMSVKTQFRIGTALILFFFCGGFSLLEYQYLKEFVKESIFRETALHVATADATRTYVKDVLRPRLTPLFPPDEFIPEAMSTTYVGREIMSRIHRQFPEFDYKRAAKNPMNPVNMADAFEMKMLDWFAANPRDRQWSGIVRKGDHSYYTQFRAIYAETECLVCHGNPQNAPKQMREIYGEKGGYGYQVGEVVAADAVFIPVDVLFLRIKEKALWVFLIGGGALVFLFGLFYLLFNRTVVSHLKGLVSTFSGITGKETLLQEVGPSDEIDQLKETFETVARHLKSAHEELKASEAKYRRLFESSQDAILICDMETRVVDINHSGIALFGFTGRTEALEMETFYQVFWDGREAAAILERLHQEGSIREEEVLMVDRVGRQRVILISAHEMREEGDKASGFVAVLRDVTEKRKLDRHLAQTEKLAAIGQLAAGVAHEINNPLGVISLYSNLIAKAATPDSQIQKDLQIIHKHSRHCKTIVESLLSFARMAEPKKSPCDIHGLMNDVLSVLEHRMEKRKITLCRDFSKALPFATVDGDQMKQVFMNLFMNAYQAMPEGGEMRISTMMKNRRTMTIEIADTGRGIEKHVLDQIFDPFFTTKAPGKGTGLGLSVSYGIVKQHDGEIKVSSTPGKGTVFRISLPV